METSFDHSRIQIQNTHNLINVMEDKLNSFLTKKDHSKSFTHDMDEV